MLYIVDFSWNMEQIDGRKNLQLRLMFILTDTFTLWLRFLVQSEVNLYTLFTVPCLAPFNTCLALHIRYCIFGQNGVGFTVFSKQIFAYVFFRPKIQVLCNFEPSWYIIFYTTLWSEQCQQLVRQTVIVVLPIVCLWDHKTDACPVKY